MMPNHQQQTSVQDIPDLFYLHVCWSFHLSLCRPTLFCRSERIHTSTLECAYRSLLINAVSINVYNAKQFI
jgi:hypothetical protein